MNRILKLTSLILLAVSFSIPAKAQLLNLGIKAGLNLQELEIKEFDGQQTIDELNSGEQKFGFHSGLYANINLPVFHIRTELLYTYINYELSSTSLSNEVKTFDFEFNRFDVPILAGIKLGPVRLNAGPVMSFTISEPNEAFQKGVKDATWGYQAGIGLDVKNISVDIRYEGAFSKMADSIRIEGEDYTTDARASQILIGIGYKLF